MSYELCNYVYKVSLFQSYLKLLVQPLFEHGNFFEPENKTIDLINILLGRRRETSALLGADFKINITTKQESHQEYYCFLDEQFYFNQ